MSSQLILLRMAAFVVDSLLIGLALMIPSTILSWILIGIAEAPDRVRLVWWTALGLVVVGILLRDGWRGRSMGKRLLGLRIRTPGGSECGWLRSFARNIPLLVPGWNLLELYLLIFSRESRRSGDRIARTYVTEE